jgi:hypothetical protein
MTGEEWLRGVFDPALRTCKPPYDELRAELRALSQSGVLSEADSVHARARLDRDERDRGMVVRRRHDLLVSGEGAEDRLEGLLTPERPLGEVEGIAVELTRIELWSSWLVLRLEAVRSQITDALDSTFEAAWEAYQRRWSEHRAAAQAPEDLWPPEPPSVARLRQVPLSVADDVGTRYHAIANATGGPEHPWRSEWRLEPAVPAAADLLRIALERGQPEGERVELVLPARS